MLQCHGGNIKSGADPDLILSCSGADQGGQYYWKVAIVQQTVGEHFYYYSVVRALVKNFRKKLY